MRKDQRHLEPHILFTRSLVARVHGNTLALFVLGLFQTLLFVAIQRIFFGVIMLEGFYSWLVMASYILCAAAVSMLMSSLFKTAAQLQAVAPVFSIITGLMGGCLWNPGIPREFSLSHA